jgi:uncharacterized protein YndB with AHSA1/START domain
MTRVFNAARNLVWDAMTKPDLLKRWLGMHNGWSLQVCEIDLRVGGAYRWVWHGPKGEVMGMSGVYREIVRPERIVSTEKFDQSWYEGEALGTLVLTERDGMTTLMQTVRYQSREVRDGVLKSGMEQGVASGYDKLDEVLGSMRATS